MMEDSKVGKRVILDDLDGKSHEPVLVRINTRGSAPHDIHIDKEEFKIGRARDNDEIILDTMISRRHCIIRCEGHDEWIIRDLSSSATFVNNVPLMSGVNQRLYNGDVIQFSISEEFKYVFSLGGKHERSIKKPKLEEQIFDNVLIEQKTFAENQECQKRVLKDKLQIKQREQNELKQELEQLLKQQRIANDCTEEFKKQISILEDKIEHGNMQEQHLQNMYSELLEKLEYERAEFEKRLNDEKQKWEEALNVSKHEKEMLEVKMKEKMEKWRNEQQSEWKSVMENRVKEEKSIQAQLLNEKTMLEEKLKETEKALKEQEAKVGTIQYNVAGPSYNTTDSCIFLEIVNDPSQFEVIDTIDLTVGTQFAIVNEEKDSVVNKVNDIMDEQLTCSICSELFVKATTLNCMHTFCEHCIQSWNKRKKECPVCRSPVITMNRSIVLDNFIDSMVENLSTRFKERRKELIEERQVMENKRKVR